MRVSYAAIGDGNPAVTPKRAPTPRGETATSNGRASPLTFLTIPQLLGCVSSAATSRPAEARNDVNLPAEGRRP